MKKFALGVVRTDSGQIFINDDDSCDTLEEARKLANASILRGETGKVKIYQCIERVKVLTQTTTEKEN